MSAKPTLKWHAVYQDGREAMNGTKGCRLQLIYDSGNPDWVEEKELEVSISQSRDPLKIRLTSLPRTPRDDNLFKDVLKLFLDNVDVESWDSSTDMILVRLFGEYVKGRDHDVSGEDDLVEQVSVVPITNSVEIPLY
jgi:hypothetical protein